METSSTPLPYKVCLSLAIDVPIAKKPSMGTVQQRLFSILGNTSCRCCDLKSIALKY